MVAIDGAALANMNPPKQNKILGEYCEGEFGEKLKKVAVDVNQLDLA